MVKVGVEDKKNQGEIKQFCGQFLICGITDISELQRSGRLRNSSENLKIMTDPVQIM